MQPVSSMAACDIAASSPSMNLVHFGAHPLLTRVVHLWAGRRRWRPRRKKLKQLISRRRYMEGTRLFEERVAKADFHVISEGSPLITWRDIRQIHASFPTNAQTIYRLKSNLFPIWNWAKHICRAPSLSVWMLVQLWQYISFGHALARIDTGNTSLIGGDGLVRSPRMTCMSECLDWTYRGFRPTPGLL